MHPNDIAAGLGNDPDQFGVAYASLPGDDRMANLRRAIGCYESVLPIVTEAAALRRWATIQDCLGTSYRKLASFEGGEENLRKAIGYFEAALRGRTEAEFPGEWAETNYNLGLGMGDLAKVTGDRSILPSALIAFENAERGYVAVVFTSNAEAARKEAAKVRAFLASVAQSSPNLLAGQPNQSKGADPFAQNQ